MNQTVQQKREAYYARMLPVLGITEVAQMQFNDHLADFFQAIALIATWQDLQEVKPYVSRYRHQENRLYNRLKRGEMVEVRAMLNGREFAIQPVAWEGIIMAYNCLVDGKVSPGCKGKMLSCQSLKDWTDDLIERA